MQYTNNFKLNLPSENDSFDINHFNENMSIIDDVLSDALSGVISKPLDLLGRFPVNSSSSVVESKLYITGKRIHGYLKIDFRPDDVFFANNEYTVFEIEKYTTIFFVEGNATFETNDKIYPIEWSINGNDKIVIVPPVSSDRATITLYLDYYIT